MREETSLEMRKIIVRLRQEGKSFREISRIAKRSVNCVKKIVDKFKNFRTLKNLHRSGRPKRLSDREEREIVREVKQKPRSSAVKISERITRHSGKQISASTIRRTLNNYGLNGRVPRKKPLISKINRKKRLQFAKKYQNYNDSFWKSVLFSDESKFEIFGSKRKTKVWRMKNKELEPQNISTTVKHGGGSVMIWGCMAASGVGNLEFIDSTMNKHDYLKILRENIKPSVRKLELPRTWIFQQDNDPKHTANIVKEYLLYNTPKQLDHPPQSPDLNPIEHLWDYLDRKIRSRTITNKESLKQALLQEWQNIPANFTESLVLSMPRRLNAVLVSKGGQTKY